MNNTRDKKEHRINGQVRFPEVRVVGDYNGAIMSSYDALQEARKEGKDLILITENGKPPVVRIEEYSKYIYDLKQREKEVKKNQKKVETKQIKLSVVIADHDLETKSKQGNKFLSKGNKVKCTLQMRGRQNQNKQHGEIVMLKFAELLSEFGSPENMPKLSGNKWEMIIKPK
jgi:translation initiation factor IF-3